MDKGKREWLWFLFRSFRSTYNLVYAISPFILFLCFPFYPLILYPFSLLTTFLPATHHV